MAMSNGVKSKPIVKYKCIRIIEFQLYKRVDKVAQLLNLRIDVDDGVIKKLEWINVCD